MAEGLDIFLLIDESGSMHGQKGTDTAGLRFSASRYLIQNLLVKKSDVQYPNRLSVIHFGDQARSNGLTDLTIGGAKVLSESVIPPFKGSLGDTSFINALQKVLEVNTSAPPYKNMRNKIIVVFTDGEPDDARKLTMKQYFDEIQMFMQQKMKGYSLYIIGIDNVVSPVKFSQTVPNWTHIAGEKNVYMLRDVKDLYTKFNQAIQQIFELPPVDQVNVTKAHDFEIQPYLDKVEFHVFTESNVRVGIKRPGGQLVLPADRDLSVQKGVNYSILTINSPAPGTWRYEIIEGTGSVNVLRNPIPFRLTLEYPDQYYPLGKPLWLRAQFTNENGEEIKELADFPLSFTAKITSPDYLNYDEDVQFLTKNKINKTYYAEKAIKMDKPGEYHIRLKVKGGTRFESANTQKIFVQSSPYVDLIVPKPLAVYPLSKQLKITGTLRRGTDVSDPKKEFNDNPNDLILAQVVSSPTGQQSPAIWLNYDGNGKFQGIIPMDMKDGFYALAIRIKGDPRIPDNLFPKEAIEVIDFRVSPTSFQIAGSLSKTIAIAIVVFLIFWILWIILWLNVLVKKFSGLLQIHINQEEVINDYQQDMRWIKPMCRKIEAMRNESEVEETALVSKPLSVVFWIRAKGEDSVVVYSGGWLSVLTMGLLSKKRVHVSKEDGLTELGDYIKITVTN